MRKIFAIIFSQFLVTCIVNADTLSLTLDQYNRDKTSLNGAWHYIVDPYENGFYDYRWRPFEDNPTPSRSAFFMDAKPRTKTELIEYDFDAAPTMTLPSDWNTQDVRLYFYDLF